jgi:hypothetical protein
LPQRIHDFEELSKNALRKPCIGSDGIEFSILLISPACFGGLSGGFRKKSLDDPAFLFRPSTAHQADDGRRSQVPAFKPGHERSALFFGASLGWLRITP